MNEGSVGLLTQALTLLEQQTLYLSKCEEQVTERRFPIAPKKSFQLQFRPSSFPNIDFKLFRTSYLK